MVRASAKVVGLDPTADHRAMGSWGLPTCVHVFASMQGCHVFKTTTHPMVVLRAWQPCMLANTQVGSPQEPMHRASVP